MKLLKTLSNYVFAAVVAVAFVACGQSQKNEAYAPVSSSSSMPATPESDPSKIVQCYDMHGNCTQAAGAIVVDSAKIVYEHRPSEIILAIRNASTNVLGNLKGVIYLYGEDGQRYDTVDFSKSCRFESDERGSISIYLGDKRVHPNQEWNRDIQLHFAKTGLNRFSFIGSDNDWCECIAKVVEVRIESFEVLD